MEEHASTQSQHIFLSTAWPDKTKPSKLHRSCECTAMHAVTLSTHYSYTAPGPITDARG